MEVRFSGILKLVGFFFKWKPEKTNKQNTLTCSLVSSSVNCLAVVLQEHPISSLVKIVLCIWEILKHQKSLFFSIVVDKPFS